MPIKNLAVFALTGTTLAILAIANPPAQANASTQEVAQVFRRNEDARQPKLKGVIKNVVGTQVLVELERSENPLMWVGVSQADLGALNLMGGTPVYVEGRKIVGLAPRSTPVANTSDFSNRVQALWAEYEETLEQPRSTPMEESLPSRPSINIQPVPEMAPANVPPSAPIPIRGLW